MIDNLKINKIFKTHIQVYSQINQFKLKENIKIHRLIMIFKKHSCKVNSKISNLLNYIKYSYLISRLLFKIHYPIYSFF